MRLLLLLAFGMISAVNAANAPLSAVGAHKVIESDFIYARADGIELHAHSYRADVSGTLPAIIDIHGGVWSSGDRMGGQVYDRALASTGLYVLAIDFRQAPAFKHPTSSRDIAAAIRYLRTHAGRLAIDAASIGLVGSSSGGHLAMLAGFMPSSDPFRGTPIANDAGAFATADDVDAAVKYVIALWPVSDPAYRYEYAQRAGRADLIRSHDAYFGSSVAMQEASVPRLLRAKQATHVPPLLIVQAGNDANIPREMTFDLLAAYQEAGGRATYLFVPNQPHVFGVRQSAETDRLVVAMRDFVALQLQPPPLR